MFDDRTATYGELHTESSRAAHALRDAGIGPGDRVAFCAERLARFKLPAAVERIAEIPRNASGKILKVELRETYREGVSGPSVREAHATASLGSIVGQAMPKR